jgi:hypothetical protein
MTTLLARISDLTKNATFKGWNFSADGKWDQGHLAYLAEPPRSLPFAPVQAWLKEQATDNIAFEATFESPNQETFFFGVRLTPLTLPQKEDALRKLLEQGNSQDSLVTIIPKIRTCLNADNLALAPPDYLELGVIALWNRVKGLKVWETGKDKIIAPAELPQHTQMPDEGFARFTCRNPIPSCWKPHGNFVPRREPLSNVGSDCPLRNLE